MTRVFLGFSVLVWLPYGILCFLQPDLLEQVAGVAARDATAGTEIRAMYGGLQSAIGGLALYALLRPAATRTALLILAFLCSGLLLARIGGLLMDASASGYTFGALAFELLSSAAAIGLLSRLPETARA